MSVSPLAKVRGLALRGWNEIPDIVATGAQALLGVAFCFIGLSIYDSKDGANKKYKQTYVVYRPDDPRVARIKKVSGLDP